MKLLTIAVPCYNSEAYMRKCIDSLLPGGEDVEIIIVDDGSQKDNTAAIADEYQAKYPSIIKVIHQENKGHGGAVNTGVENAEGLYFKVVDSDDWVDESAYLNILKKLRKIAAGPVSVDLFIANYVYEKEGQQKKRIMRFLKNFPQDVIIGWQDMKPLDPAHYLLMHNIIYRTELIRESGLKLPEHTFYVDNLYAFIPLSKAKTLYYTNEDFYRYYIGRGDQSVNEQVMMSRIDQQIKVNNAMIEYMATQRNVSGNCKKMLSHSLGIIMIVTSILLIRIGTPQALEQKQKLWLKLKKECPFIYRRIRYSIMGASMHLPGRPGRKFAVYGYRLCNKVYGFN